MRVFAVNFSIELDTRTVLLASTACTNLAKSRNTGSTTAVVLQQAVALVDRLGGFYRVSQCVCTSVPTLGTHWNKNKTTHAGAPSISNQDTVSGSQSTPMCRTQRDGSRNSVDRVVRAWKRYTGTGVNANANTQAPNKVGRTSPKLIKCLHAARARGVHILRCSH